MTAEHRKHDPEDPALAETVADAEVDAEVAGPDAAGPDETARLDMPVPEALRAPGGDEEGAGYDPEAGRTRIADRSGIARHVFGRAGQFVLGILAALLGIGVVIHAVVLPGPVAVVAAILVAPPALLWAFLRWRRWLAGAPYAYRLLLTLDEREAAAEMLAKDRERRRKRAERRIAELEGRDPEEPG